MKKSVKGIIGLSALLLALGGGAAALLLTEPKDGGESSSSSQSEVEKQVKILIYDDKVKGTDPETGADLKGVIKSVKVKNSTDEFYVVQNGVTENGSGIIYTFDGYQEVNMNNALIGTLANNANGLTSEDVVEENCTDLAKFGLENPEITVDIEYETGTKCRMFIGNDAPVGDAKYVMIDGVDTVFTVRISALANYSKTLDDFVETTMLKSPDVYPKVEKLTVSRKGEDDLILEYDKSSDDEANRGGTSSTHIMTSPTFAYLTVERATDIITGMFGLSADSIYAVQCTESDIAEAGLKEPFCSVTMECDDGNDYKLLLSEYFDDSEGKSCYAMFEGGNVIYVLDAEKAKWVTVQPIDVASRMFVASYVWNITDLSVKSGDVSYEFDITQTKEPGEDEKLTADNFSVTLNGEDFDAERYRKFYSFLIKANGESFALGEDVPSGEPMAVLEYTDSYMNKTMKFEFYEKSALQALVVADGESKFNISKSYVETLIENAENLKSDTEFKTTWK
ncbi:MAG: DUF4340 domain-containing protein [Ruminococcus sp.]|nr:DUF4340 domain-containing protein [Ruminococcus sp.]